MTPRLSQKPIDPPSAEIKVAALNSGKSVFDLVNVGMKSIIILDILANGYFSFTSAILVWVDVHGGGQLELDLPSHKSS